MSDRDIHFTHAGVSGVLEVRKNETRVRYAGRIIQMSAARGGLRQKLIALVAVNKLGEK